MCVRGFLRRGPSGSEWVKSCAGSLTYDGVSMWWNHKSCCMATTELKGPRFKSFTHIFLHLTSSEEKTEFELEEHATALLTGPFLVRLRAPSPQESVSSVFCYSDHTSNILVHSLWIILWTSAPCTNLHVELFGSVESLKISSVWLNSMAIIISMTPHGLDFYQVQRAVLYVTHEVKVYYGPSPYVTTYTVLGSQCFRSGIQSQTLQMLWSSPRKMKIV